ncbi:NAD kinase [Priestia aryabhattai]|uniref:NAD kinase n=1 Tax=Priestia flexa TaxID=86664 RepID=UPI000BA14903|nr:NAD kinase [Priestia flexa]MDT2045187.1 NAD kinase [Priestia flexa]OZT12235.1 NAD kinase [Priestia aryabhattai]
MSNRRNVYFFHPRNKETNAAVKPLQELAVNYDFTVVEHAKDANIIVSIGDDGAFLQAVRQTGFRDDCLYAGVATSEQLNFYCDFHINEKEKMIDAITSENIEVRRFPVLETTIDQGTTFHSLNECLVRSALIKTFTMDVFINENHFETFRGDGMVISTPTGSTAYNKSVNGAVVDPLLPCMQISELASLNNNNYRTLGSSFILSSEHTLTLKLSNDNSHYPVIGLDNEAISTKHVDQIQVRLSDRQIKTVKLKDNSFWQRVQRTFL